MKNVKEQIIILLKNYISGIESHLENSYEVLKKRELIQNFLNKNKDIDLILENELDYLKELTIDIFGEESKQKLIINRISFIYEGTKICDDLPQLNGAKKELASLLEELRRKIKDYDNDVDRISKNNDKILEKTQIYRVAITSLENGEYIKNSKTITDVILNSDITESEMYYYILYLTKLNAKKLEGKESVEDISFEERDIQKKDYIKEYFDIIKNSDFSSLKNILPLKNMSNFDELKSTLLSLFEDEIRIFKKELQDNSDLYHQRILEQLQKNYNYLKEYSNEPKINKIVNNEMIYKLPQIRNNIIMEDFRKENFNKKDFKDIIELLKEFRQGKIKKEEAFYNKLINTYKITKNDVNIIIINVKENTFVAIKLYHFGSTNVEKDVLERLNRYKEELELLIDELNNPVGYKEIMDSNELQEKIIFDTLTLNAKVG